MKKKIIRAIKRIENYFQIENILYLIIGVLCVVNSVFAIIMHDIIKLIVQIFLFLLLSIIAVNNRLLAKERIQNIVCFSLLLDLLDLAKIQHDIIEEFENGKSKRTNKKKSRA